MSAAIRIGSTIHAMFGLAHYYASVVDAHRFENESDRVLAKVGDEDFALYPEAEALAALGLNVEFMALALKAGRLDPSELGDIVDDVEFGDITVDQANRELYAKVRPEDRKVIDFEDGVLSGLGFEVDDLRACMRLGRLDDPRLRELVMNVCRGWTRVYDANTALAYRADPSFAS